MESLSNSDCEEGSKNPSSHSSTSSSSPTGSPKNETNHLLSTVHRSNLSISRVQNVVELSMLNVEAYDQQAYENEVFNKVDQVLIDDSDKEDNENILNQTILGLSTTTDDKSDPTNNDEEVLRLVKLESTKRLLEPPTTSFTAEVGENDDSDDECYDDQNFEYETDVSSDSQKSSKIINKKLNIKKIKLVDDGDIDCFKERMKDYAQRQAQEKLNNILSDGTEITTLNKMVIVEGDLKIPEKIWDSLFEHQRIGLKWLWELHQSGTGGILGDEMGLGKTIQMIAFLVAIKVSEYRDRHTNYDGLGPIILVCPATVMHQWLMEFHKWWPPFRIAILHNTGTFSGKRTNLVETIHKTKSVLIVSYQGAVIYQDYLHKFNWHYAILDEGHKIRNPDAQVTLCCKRFRTPHRIILSGSPIQNNLRELWSVFDFIYPGKLGTLPVFMEQFASPITQGGYANASDVQVQIAYKCACILRDTIKPFLLRRSKSEINDKLKLPEKTEQVLFCKLTPRQQACYKAYLASPTIRDIKRGLCRIFVGLVELRKICNHPDLFDSTECRGQVKGRAYDSFKQNDTSDDEYGDSSRSGKMMVVDVLLKLWKQQNHKVLLFTQSRQMLRIIMKYLDKCGYNYMYMDGQTQIGSRQTMIEKFNTDTEIFIFLLTTRVGGVGVNLTGANRIIIYDPDWNPSTDIQARERAWRIGQNRDVIIYRLITAGTIEEKIYHRQVFKLYLTNRILRDAKQKRFFKTNDLHELFTLGDNDKNIETKALFEENLQINAEDLAKKKSKKKHKKDRKSKSKSKHDKKTMDLNVKLSDKKKAEMLERVKAISKMISQQNFPSSSLPNTNVEPYVGNERSKRYKNIHPFFVGTEENNKGIRIQAKNESEPVSASKHTQRGKHYVEHLVRQTVYKEPKSSLEEMNSDCDDDKKSGHDYILKRLFKKSSISGALKHDKIESDSVPDYKIVENEAEKIAREAIKMLKESRRQCFNSMSGAPNWTGRNGFVATLLRQERHLAESSADQGSRLVPKRLKKTYNPKPTNKKEACSLSSLFGESTSFTNASLNNNNNNNDNSKPFSLMATIKKRSNLNPIPQAGGISHSRSGGSGSTNGSNNNLEQELAQDEDEQRILNEFEGVSEGTGAEVMAMRLRNFLMNECPTRGEAQTDEVLDFFKHHYSNANSCTATFKAILYKMCEFERRGKFNKGFWVIKSEFRS